MSRLATSLLLVMLLAGPALADEPFDLSALRQAHPGAAWVVLERTLVFDMPSPDLLRVEESRRIAILEEGGREELALFEAVHRPGCRVPSEIRIRTVTRTGEEHLLTEADLVRQPRGDHLDPARVRVDLVGPRRGLAPGSLLEERVQTDYPADCYAGLLSTSRRLGEAEAPVLSERVEVRCAGSGCRYAVRADAFDGVWTEGESGALLQRTHVPRLTAEEATPVERLPTLQVTNSDDPLAVGRVLGESLSAAQRQAGKVAPTYAREAKDQFPRMKSPAARLAAYLGDRVLLMGKGSFWGVGFDFGDPPRAEDRRLLPLEWWAVAVAALRPHGGVPLLLDMRDHRPPSEIGVVTEWTAVGVLLPEVGVVTQEAWIPFHEGLASPIAGRWAMRLDGDEPELFRFPSGAAGDLHSWAGAVRPIGGGFVQFDLQVGFRGGRGATLRRGHEALIERWKAQPKKYGRPSEAERDRAFLAKRLFGRDIALGEVTESNDGLDAHVIYTTQHLARSGDGVVVFDLQLPERPMLSHLGSADQRRSDFALKPGEQSFDLLIEPPSGHEPAGLPPGGRVDEGPVHVELSWAIEDGGVRMRFRCAIDERIVSVDHAEAVMAAARLSRMAGQTHLLFVPTTP
jgi:hypothetical protein